MLTPKFHSNSVSLCFIAKRRMASMLQGFASVMQGLQTRPGFSHCKITGAKIGQHFVPEFEKLNQLNPVLFRVIL